MGIPGLKVVIPSNPADAKGLLTSSIFDDDPVLFIETGMLYGSRGLVPVDDGFSVPLGKANVIRPGEDVTVLTYGRGVRESLTAAEQAAEQGISVEVVDLRTLLPLDVPGILESVSKTRRAVIVHYAIQVRRSRGGDRGDNLRELVRGAGCARGSPRREVPAVPFRGGAAIGGLPSAG